MAWLPSISCRAVAEKMKWTRYATSESKVSAGSPNLFTPSPLLVPVIAQQSAMFQKATRSASSETSSRMSSSSPVPYDCPGKPARTCR